MPEPIEIRTARARPPIAEVVPIMVRKLRVGYFIVQGLNSLAASYYFNYIFFYMAEHFGFGNRKNLLLSALYGFIYMIVAWYAGPFGQRRGYFFTLRVGLYGMASFMMLGGLAPVVFGYSHVTMLAEWIILAGWAGAVCLTWPTLQALLSQHQSPGQSAWTAGIYNIMWAGTAAVAYLTSGALLDTFGGETLFWLSAAINVIQIFMLPRLQKFDTAISATEPGSALAETHPVKNTRVTPSSKNFLWLARIANPFAYVAIYGVLPIIPKLAEKLGLSPTYASLICSTWFWARLGAFALFWRWTAWHYRFRWLAGAFIAMVVSFIMIPLSSNIWMLIFAQLIFGLTIGLIYYSSLFYAMDLRESKGKDGGFHEAAIGLGIFIGPTAGVAALHFFPERPDAGTWGITALLMVGLIFFLVVRSREGKTAGPASAGGSR